MTEIQQHTMSRESAERLTEQIRHTATTFMEARDKLSGLIREAQDGQAHVALGYRSWTEYVAAVCSDTPLMRLSRDERRVIVSDLAEQGMSSRAIAPVVGATHATVQADIRGGKNLPPAEVPTFDPTPSWDPVNTETGEITPEPRPVTGLDGKTYTRPTRAALPAVDREVSIVNDIRLYLGHIATSNDIATLPLEARQHIITALENTLTALRSTP